MFDDKKMRTAGTEAEQFAAKADKTAAQYEKKLKKVLAFMRFAIGSNERLLQKDWRQQHEEFVSAIRAAKEVQDHLAKGGKLSDLPPVRALSYAHPAKPLCHSRPCLRTLTTCSASIAAARSTPTPQPGMYRSATRKARKPRRQRRASER